MAEYQEQNPTSITEARASTSSKVAKLVQDLSKEGAERLFVAILREGLRVVAVKQQPNPEQLMYIASMIVKRYYFLSLADIKLCLEMGINGDFGEIYRLDAASVLWWLNRYNQERASL